MKIATNNGVIGLCDSMDYEFHVETPEEVLTFMKNLLNGEKKDYNEFKYTVSIVPTKNRKSSSSTRT